MAKMLGLPSTIFFWALAVYVSFLPIMQHHHKDGNTKIRPWEKTVNIIILCCFVGAVLNLIEKIMIQLVSRHPPVDVQVLNV